MSNDEFALGALSSFQDLVGYFFVYFFVDLIILLSTAVMIPTLLVLGNNLVTPLMALILASFLLSFFVVSTVPIMELIVSRFEYEFTSRDWMAIFVAINVFFLWLLARFAQVVGMGISSWMVALVIGIVLSLIQGWSVRNLLRDN